MTTQFRWSILGMAALVAIHSPARVLAAETPAPPATTPPFAEVYSIVRSTLSHVTEAELNRAAVLGFLSQLQSKATLITNPGPAAAQMNNVPLVSKSVVLDSSYGLIRIARVSQGLSGEALKSYQSQMATNKLKGLIVDLRYANGIDYAAAAETADLFLDADQPLLRWGDQTARSTAKNSAISVPVVLLVNQETRGAAEALAAALRQADGALLIGSPTAGQAFLYREFPLSNGQVLRIASGNVSAGNGQPLSDSGVVPDIRIVVDPDDEKAYFEDPYKVLPKAFAQAARPAANELLAGQSTNRARRRLNEAELVRMQRDGIDFEAEPLPTTAAAPTGPVINDPALGRAVDLLKGLALAAKRR